MTADLHHLAAAYALDALDNAERAAFEAHYPSCDICSSEVVDYRATASELAVERVAPPADLRARVMAEVAQTRQLSPRVAENVVRLADRRRARTNLMLGAVAAVAVLIAGVVGFGIGNSGRSSASDDIVALLAEPDVSVQPLAGDVEGSLSVAWSGSEGRLAVLGSQLPEPGTGLVYALWLLDADGATPSLLFTPDDGAVRSIGDLPGDPSGWGVTLEPEGGSPQPTGDILFAAEI